jgi:hypothetical protein
VRNFGWKLGVTAVLVVACMMLFVGAAFGAGTGGMQLTWGNGTYGGGNTHHWITASAARMAEQHGATWVNAGLMVSQASVPDLVFMDHINHNYNRWGSYPSFNGWGTRFGNPQIKVQHYYNLAVAALKRGDKNTASRMMGLLSHYFADVNEPLHTQESRLETDMMHRHYETAVDRLWSSSSSHQDWLHWDGYQYVPNASAFTVAAAVKSHSHYSALVSNFAHHGFNSTVRSITLTQLNHAVNGIADLILSAQYDADSVNAFIDSASPSTATTGQPVTFVGHGKDPHDKIVAWQWRSNIDGVLSTKATFTTTGLSAGIHTIYFKVKCSRNKWSNEASIPFVVGAAGTSPLPVYRFSNRKTGGYLLTASEAEKRAIIAKMSATWSFEGVAYAIDAASPVNVAPLYRFHHSKPAAYFYTASDTEKASVLKDASYRLEGVGWNVSLSATGAQPVYRLWSRKKGVFLWTASAAEAHALSTQKENPWRNDGVAYYFAPPW